MANFKTKCTLTRVLQNPGLRGDSPTTIRRSHGTARN